MRDETIIREMKATPGAVVYRQQDETVDVQAMKARVAEYERILADPASVWANMLHGKIARPQALDHYEECKSMVEKLEEQVRVLRNELSVISHLHPGPGEPGSIARRALAATEGLANEKDERRP